MKLDCFYFSAFDLEFKTTEILKYIQPFPGRKMVKGDGKITKF